MLAYPVALGLLGYHAQYVLAKMQIMHKSLGDGLPSGLKIGK